MGTPAALEENGIRTPAQVSGMRMLTGARWRGTTR